MVLAMKTAILLLAAITSLQGTETQPRIRVRDSKSHDVCQSARIPAKAGTTSTVSPDSEVLVVPPSGGSAGTGSSIVNRRP